MASLKAIDIGKSLIGKTTYVWGGGRTASSIAKGQFDCSGFVQYAFKQAGLDLGDGNTDTLVKKGVAVDPKNMQPGDVVFFDTYKKNGHVGIYLGNGKFIGSQSSTGVAVANMDSGYFANHFSGVVRRMTGGSSSSSSGSVSTGGSKPWINQQAGSFAPTFKYYGSKYGVDPSLLEAISMQESSMGTSTGKNIMEANGGGSDKVGSYEESISAGTQEFSARLKDAGGDVKKALAAYNMGKGILSWFDKYSNGQYSKDVMQQFSNYQKQKYGYRVYGDPSYVDHVLRYYK